MFQSTRLREARLSGVLWLIASIMFQSTRLREARPYLWALAQPDTTGFNPRAYVRRDWSW